MPEIDPKKFKDPRSVLNANIFGFVKTGEYNLAFNILQGLLSLRLFNTEKIKHILSGFEKLMARK
ncbi:MAG: hypothetical protein WC741_04505 [Patescibacteria group bacterium]